MKPATTLRTSLLIATLASLSACGGGGGDSSGGDPPAPPPPPPPTTVTIGGTISGLTGSVTLRDNGADDLVLSAGGSFTFARPLNSGATYSVSVSSQPASQTCTVSNGSGTTASSNVTNVSVSCATTQAGGAGSLDLAFGTNGKVTTDFSGAPPLSKMDKHS